MSNTPSYDKVGWELKTEPAPSLVRHYWPTFGNHRMSNLCWCRPFIQNEASYTVVMHNEHGGGADNWPFASQRR